MAVRGSLALLLMMMMMLVASSHAGFIKHITHEFNKHKNDLNNVIKLDKLFDVKKLFGGDKLHDLTVNDVRVSSCGSASDVVKVNSLSVAPDPLRLPGTITASFDVTVSRNISQQVSVDLDVSIKKSPFGWIKIPCIDHEGSCTYNDVCPTSRAKDFPKEFSEHGIPCNCPVAEGHYALPSTQIAVDKISVPSFLKHGEFHAKATAKMAGAQLGCIDVHFKID